MGEIMFTPLMGETVLTTTRKVLYSNFMPSKYDEELLGTRQPYCVAQTLVEMRDLFKPPSPDPTNHPWTIRKVLTPTEAATGSFFITYNDAFEHVFRYWSMEMAERVVVASNRQSVVVNDVTDEDNTVRYSNTEEVFIQQGFSGGQFYVLGCLELARARKLKPGEEVGIYWDIETSTFRFKVLGRTN